MLKIFVMFTYLALALLVNSDERETSQVVRMTYHPPHPQASNLQVQEEEWVLVFEDNFEGPEFDPDKWVPCYWWHRHWETEGCTNDANNELQWYQPENVIVQDGTLILRAKEETVIARDVEGEDQVFRYTSGMVSTGRMVPDTSMPPRFAFQYGYAEIRARIPSGQGLWPAFWLLPTNHHYRPEIDVMEVLGHEPATVYGYIHHPDYSASFRSWTGPDLSAGWHIFAIDWHPDEIIWYVDGVAFFRFTIAEKIPDTPMYLLFTLAVGGWWPGSPDTSTIFPADFEIDYVEVWQRTSRETQTQ